MAIIEVAGTILHSDGFIKHQIDQVAKDKDVKAVVVRIDSPGGTVTGSDYLYHHLQEMLRERKLPVVVSMGGIAASGGYYVAMAAGDKQTIYAEPTTWTGSIGVIIPHYDLSGLLERFDVSDDSISSDPMKQMGSLTRKWPKEEREKELAIMQGLVDDSFARFKQIVLDSRAPLRNNPDWQTEVFTGRIFAADQAKAHGLVDELGYLEDAIDRVISLAGLSRQHVEVVKYVKPAGLLDQLVMGPQGQARKPIDAAALMDLARASRLLPEQLAPRHGAQRPRLNRNWVAGALRQRQRLSARAIGRRAARSPAPPPPGRCPRRSFPAACTWHTTAVARHTPLARPRMSVAALQSTATKSRWPGGRRRQGLGVTRARNDPCDWHSRTYSGSASADSKIARLAAL